MAAKIKKGPNSADRKRVEVHFPRVLYNRLSANAKKRNVAVGMMIRSAVEYFLESNLPVVQAGDVATGGAK